MQGPTIDTSYGLSNAIVSKYNAASNVESCAAAPEHGIMGFFSAGASVSVSDNGTSNAQLYVLDSSTSLLCALYGTFRIWSFRTVAVAFECGICGLWNSQCT